MFDATVLSADACRNPQVQLHGQRSGELHDTILFAGAIL